MPIEKKKKYILVEVNIEKKIKTYPAKEVYSKNKGGGIMKFSEYLFSCRLISVRDRSNIVSQTTVYETIF